MPTPAYLSPVDYPAIRRMLGLAGDDVTSLPDLVIEERPYLLRVEREVGPLLDACEIDMDTADQATVEWVLESIQYLVAGRIAAVQHRASTGNEVTSEKVGPVGVNYRSGPEWKEISAALLREGVEALSRVCSSARDLSRQGVPSDFIVLAGPTRKAKRSAAGGRTLESMLEALTPNLLGGS